MKKLVLAAFVLSALSALLVTSADAQVKSVAAANQPGAKTTATPQPETAGRRARVLGPEVKPASSTGRIASVGGLQTQAKSDFNNGETSRSNRVDPSAGAASDSADKPASPSSDNSNRSASNLKPAGSPATPANTVAPTQVYRVGVRDVLDIQLDQLASKSSTLFTVLPGGMLEYPLAGGPFPVSGMTTSEIAALLRQRIKIFDNPNVAVTVRDYASHAVTVSGFVAAPGTKLLRREAVPLYTVLAEALILPEAARATITRQGRYPLVIDLKDASLSATLVIPGDTIRVSGPAAGPTEFYFVSGEIVSPGQKPFHAGLTLTQAIIASGGVNPSAGAKVRISRQGPDGRLNTEEHNLRKIQSGKMPDPVLQTGDRIEVTNAN